MPTLVTGLQSLISAASGWLLALVPIGGGLLSGYHWFMSGPGSGGDEMVAAQHKRGVRSTILGTILAMSAMGLVKVLAGFFGG